MADEQAALLAQIKALSGAIDQRKANGPYSNRGGYGQRGRGSSSIAGNSSRHRSLVLSGAQQNKQQTPDEAGSSLAKVPSAGAGASGSDQDAWVKRKSTHNMSLVSKTAFDKTEPARLAALAASQSAKATAIQAKKEAKAGKKKVKSSNAVRRGDNMGEVIVDGVVFQFDESGTKLVKKDPQPSEEGPSSGGAGSPVKTDTPLQTSIDGQKYVRTKTGNLISKELLEKREAKRKLARLSDLGKEIGSRQRDTGGARKPGKVVRKRGLCSFYNKTGQCKRGLSCPYTHNPAKVALCPGSLRPSGCVLPPGSCPLSHDKKPERVPHCVHYLRLGSCRNGDDCDYVHPAPGVTLTNDSPICMDFSDLGWCQRGASCLERHTWDCPEFLRTGSCTRKGCKLMHVIRGENLKPREEEHDLADDELFVRDDGAADEVGQKRKRPSSDGEEGDGEGSEGKVESDGEETEGQHPTWRTKKKTRDFSRQQDFISLGGDLDEEVGSEEDDDDDDDDDNDNDDQSSVHSDSSED